MRFGVVLYRWCILVLAAAPVLATAADDPLRRLKSERLVYSVGVRRGLGFITMDLGKATFTVSRAKEGGEEFLVFKGHADGGIPGFPYEAVMVSRVRASDYKPVEFYTERIRPRYKKRMLWLHDYGAEYFKHVHCEAPTLCHNPAHIIERDGKRVHCPDCHDPRHYVWGLRDRLRYHYDRTVYDILAPFYILRGAAVSVGGPKQSVRVLDKRDIFDVGFAAVGEAEITVPAGKFACFRLVPETTPVNEHAKKTTEFEGFFGLHGNVEVYAEKRTRRLVLVRGQVTLGATFDVEATLVEQAAEYLPAKAE